MPKPDRYDQQWIDKQLMPFPLEFRKSLLNDYYAESSSFIANTNLRLSTLNVANALNANPQLFSTFSKDEQALIKESAMLAISSEFGSIASGIFERRMTPLTRSIT